MYFTINPAWDLLVAKVCEGAKVIRIGQPSKTFAVGDASSRERRDCEGLRSFAVHKNGPDCHYDVIIPISIEIKLNGE